MYVYDYVDFVYHVNIIIIATLVALFSILFARICQSLQLK